MEGERRQLAKFDFYRLDPRWRAIEGPEKRRQKEEFAAVALEFAPRVEVRSYSLVGVRGDCDLLLWSLAGELEAFQARAARLNRTALAPYLSLPYSYLAMKRPSAYVGGHAHPGQEGREAGLRPVEARYLIVYPFVKTREWYLLPHQERQRMMETHFTIGHRYPGVRINTTYSFGLDDQEFVVAFTTDSLASFLDLVMELRETEASRYTQRDTPIFACVAKGLPEALDDLGG